MWPCLKKSSLSLDNLQSTLGNFSNTKMNLVTNFLRAHGGKKSVQAYYREHMIDQGKILQHLYKKEIVSFHDTKGNELKRPVVWADAHELVDAVVERVCWEGFCKSYGRWRSG